MSKLLALDQASHTTGYAIFVDGKLASHGKFTLNDSDLGTRLNKFRNKIKSLVLDNGIEEVIFEDIQLQEKIEGQNKNDPDIGTKNIQTFKILAEVFGITYELLTEMGIPNRAILAGTWKSVLGIKGHHRSDQKKDAQRWVYETYHIKPTEDECDAICIGSHLYHKREPDFDWA